MASAPKFAHLLLMVLFFLALAHAASEECKYGHGCFNVKAATQKSQNRKVLYAMHGKEVGLKGADLHGSTKSNIGRGGGFEDWELRRVPAGPDPLHHNGAGPKKPKTP